LVDRATVSSTRREQLLFWIDHQGLRSQARLWLWI